MCSTVPVCAMCLRYYQIRGANSLILQNRALKNKIKNKSYAYRSNSVRLVYRLQVVYIEKSRALCPSGRFPPSFIHQIIIITGLNKLYDCMFSP